MTRQPDWEAARKRDYIREHGSERIDSDRPAGPLLVKARRNGACHDCKQLITRGQLIALRRPGVFCESCAAKAFKDGRI
jgi:hypothetical protein